MDARLAGIIYQSWAKPDRRDLFDWAPDNVVLAGAYAKPGRLNLKSSPWLRRPAESLRSHRVQRVNGLAGVQTFKSGLGETYIQYRIKEDPAQIMHNLQTDDVSKKIWRTRILTTFEASPATRDILPTARTEKSRNVISFPGCDYTIQGGGHNESNLQSISYQVIVNDEVWLYEPGYIAEAEARSDAFGLMRKIYNCSQGAEKDSEWDQVFNSGLVHTLVVRCPDCNKPHPLIWSHKMPDGSWAGVVWDRKKYLDGTPDIDRAVRTVHYRCPLCGFHHAAGEVSMRKLVATCDYSTDYPRAGYGEYDLTPGREIEVRGLASTHSYQWNSLVSVPLEQLVEEWLKADHAHKLGDITAKKQFYQKKLAIFWSDDLSNDKVALQLSGYRMGESYIGETDRFMAADYQEGRAGDTPHFWVVVRAFIKGIGSSGLIWTGRVENEAELVEVSHKYGVSPAGVVIDGADKRKMIAAMCYRHGWKFMVGDEKEAFLHINKRTKKKFERAYSPVGNYWVNKGQRGRPAYVKFVKWSNPTIKDMLCRLRDGKGVAWELPGNLPDWYNDQIDSEIRKRKNIGGRWRRYWVAKSTSNPNNHIWDCECMVLVRAVVAGVIPFDADLDADPAKESQGETKPTNAKAKSKQPKEDERQMLLGGH